MMSGYDMDLWCRDLAGSPLAHFWVDENFDEPLCWLRLNDGRVLGIPNRARTEIGRFCFELGRVDSMNPKGSALPEALALVAILKAETQSRAVHERCRVLVPDVEVSP